MKRRFFITITLLFFLISIGLVTFLFYKKNKKEDIMPEKSIDIELSQLLPNTTSYLLHLPDINLFQQIAEAKKSFISSKQKTLFANETVQLYFQKLTNSYFSNDTIKHEVYVAWKDTTVQPTIFIETGHSAEYARRQIEKELSIYQKPIIKKIDTTQLVYYPLANQTFICCFYGKGYLAASIQPKNIKSLIQQKTKRDKQLQQLLKKFPQRNTFYFQIKNKWYNYHCIQNNKKIELKGNYPIIVDTARIVASINDTLLLQGNKQPIIKESDLTQYLPDSISRIISYQIADYKKYTLKKQLIDQEENSPFYLNKTNNPLAYFQRHFDQFFLNIHFKDSSAFERSLYIIQLKDSAKAFNDFRKELKQTKNLHYLYYRWVKQKTRYIYHLANKGWLSNAFGKELTAKDQSYVSFYQNKLLVADSINTLLYYIKETPFKNKRKGLPLNNFYWDHENLKDSVYTNLPQLPFIDSKNAKLFQWEKRNKEILFKLSF